MIKMQIVSEATMLGVDSTVVGRHVDLRLWDDIVLDVVYRYSVGLPLSGDLEVILNARLADLWDLAVEKNDVLSNFEWLELNYTNEGKSWFNDNPGAKQLFALSISEIETRIDAWDLSSIPNPAQNEIKLTIQALVASVRVLAHQLNLLD